MERIASGYALAEGPVAAPDGGVVFSDALGGGIFAWSPGTGAVSTVVESRRGVGGMARHADGGLVVTGRDVSHLSGGEPRTLFSDPTATGVNDLTADPDGNVVAGLMRHRPFRGEAPVPGEFVLIRGDGASETVMDGVEWVNGCAFSPDGATFYGCDYHRGVVLAADRAQDGFGAPRVLAELPGGEADGLAVAEDGTLWIALGARGAVGRLSPAGELLEELPVPASFVASLCFGGSDRRDLFITTGGDASDPQTAGAVFHTRATVPGVIPPAVRI